MNSVSKLISAAAFFSMVSCQTYDAPPEVKLQLPEGGAFAVGTPLTLEFSEPIDPATLSVTLWYDVRDIEGEIPADATALVKSCTPAKKTCGDVTLTMGANNLTATLEFNLEGLGAAGPPIILDVEPGLADKEGNDTGNHIYYDFQFRTEQFMNTEPVEFDDGVYIIVGSVTKPLPAVLTLISDVKVLPSGEFRLAGGEGDPITNEFANNTQVPEELMVDETNLGWTAFVSGFIRLEDGKRLLETKPIPVDLPLGPVTLKMSDVRLFGEIVKNAEGKDRIEGTLSFSKITLVNGARSTEYEGGAAAVSADWVPADRAPTGHPVVCGDLCGVVTGLCNPPADFPGETFCDEYEAK
ncbi:MAG: Ig-like domain-containing protein [bacterium]